MTGAEDSIFRALDLIEYAEMAAHYKYLNLTAGELGDGLNPKHLCRISESWKVRQKLLWFARSQVC